MPCLNVSLNLTSAGSELRIAMAALARAGRTSVWSSPRRDSLTSGSVVEVGVADRRQERAAMCDVT